MPASSSAAPAQLEIRLLGELELRRADQTLSLPPSKKTRALLAYLALSGRPHRRESLCGLLWDVTDDPRGALRWSLSKLRKLVDDPASRRLVSDRERVGFERHGAAIDVFELRAALAPKNLAAAPLDALERACERCSGELLEGLDLPDFDAYQAWLVGEREDVRRLRARALAELVGRLSDAPARALPHARAWTRVDPMEPEARFSLLRMALRSGERQEAERQYQAARRLFAELDPAKELSLTAAWHALRSDTGAQSIQGKEAVSESGSPGGDPASMAALPPQPTAPQPTAPQPTAPQRRTHAGVAPAAASATLPLVGRDEERGTLRGALGDVASRHRARLLVITGEPGIGKSRLLRALVDEARALAYPLLWGEAHEGEAGRPYGPWIDALRRLPAAAPDGPLGEGLSPLLGPTHETSSREALFAGVASSLQALTEGGRQPLLVALEDIHWLDEGSAELLHYVVRTARQLPVLFVLSARTAELSDNSVVLRVLRSMRRDVEQSDLPLSALSQAETAALVAQVNPQLDAQAVHRRSGGNALYALELARAGSLDVGAGSLADAVRERLDRLTPEAADLLRWCAVLGAFVQPTQLTGLSSLDAQAQLQAFEELERHALLRVEGAGYGFCHDLVRQVVYGGLSQPRRVLMHRCAAETLRAMQDEDRAVDEAVVADIARHAAAANEHALAAAAHVQAGRRCLKLAAFENASVLARRGMRHAEALPEPARVRAMLELHDISLWACRPADADRFCEEVQRLSETALEHGCLEHARLGFNMQSYLLWERGDWSHARAHMAMAEASVRGGQGPARVEALAQAARCEALLERDMALAESYLREARASVRELSEAPAVLADAEGLLKRFVGEFDAAGELFRRARMGARVSRDRYAELQSLLSACELSYDAGRLDEALAQAREAVSLAGRGRDDSERPYAGLMLGLARLALGEREAESEVHAALSALEEVDAKHRSAFGLNRAAQLLLDEGRHEQALTLAHRAHGVCELLEWPSEGALSLVTLGRAHLAAGDASAAASVRTQLAGLSTDRLSAHAQDVVARWLNQG